MSKKRFIPFLGEKQESEMANENVKVASEPQGVALKHPDPGVSEIVVGPVIGRKASEAKDSEGKPIFVDTVEHPQKSIARSADGSFLVPLQYEAHARKYQHLS